MKLSFIYLFINPKLPLVCNNFNKSDCLFCFCERSEREARLRKQEEEMEARERAKNKQDEPEDKQDGRFKIKEEIIGKIKFLKNFVLSMIFVYSVISHPFCL